MDRWTSLDKLNDNWPGKFAPGRLSVFERKLRRYSDDALEHALELCMLECRWPPVISDIASRAGEFDRKADRKKNKRVVYKPGDQVPGRPEGERYLTVDEALSELAWMRETHPEAFDPRSDSELTLDSKAKLELSINRMYKTALQNCIHNNGRELAEPQQSALF